MPLEPINLLLGATLGALAREVVEARKARRSQRARDEAVTHAMTTELGEIHRIVTANIEMLRTRRHEAKQFEHFREERFRPLYRVPTRVDDLLRESSAADLIQNAQIIRLLSQVVALATYLNGLESERLRYVALFESRLDRAPEADEKGLYKREGELLTRSAELVLLVSRAGAVVEVIRKARSEKPPRAIKIRSRYVIFRLGPQHVLPTDAHVQCLRTLAARAGEEGATHGLSPPIHDATSDALEQLARWGLARRGFHIGDRSRWWPTSRGYMFAGGEFPIWTRATSPDPEEGVIVWAAFWQRKGHEDEPWWDDGM